MGGSQIGDSRETVWGGGGAGGSQVGGEREGRGGGEGGSPARHFTAGFGM